MITHFEQIFKILAKALVTSLTRYKCCIYGGNNDGTTQEEGKCLNDGKGDGTIIAMTVSNLN